MRDVKTALLVAMLGLAWVTPTLADSLVVRITGPAGLKAGQVIPTGTSVTLPANSRATLLSEDGHTINLTGPFAGPIAETGGGSNGNANAVSVLSRLMTEGGSDSSALGVMRAGITRSPYAIDLDQTVHCQVADKAPVFERNVGSAEDHMTITTSSGEKATLGWADGEDSLDWPSSVPFHEGSYWIRLDSRSSDINLTVHTVPANIHSEVAVATWMAEHNCPKQARGIVAELH